MTEKKTSKGKTSWTIIRTAMFYIVGLMNTAFIKVEDVGSWKNYVGYLFLLIAVVDTIFLIKKVIQKKQNETENKNGH